MLNRMRNYHNSLTHRIPPEILGAIASHLEDDKSLINATSVCHLWRSVLLSSPRLWSHIIVKNERKALIFLERSKSAPVSIVLDFDGCNAPSKKLRKSLKRATKRLATLQAVHLPLSLLGELLTQPLPILISLDVVTFGPLPSVRTLAATNLNQLTNFSFALCNCSGFEFLPGIGDSLLNFLRRCPLLEVIFLGYGERDEDIEFMTDEKSTKAVSLPFLQSFTHESPTDRIHMGLFNRLSLPPTCEVIFTITDVMAVGGPWNLGFPTLPRGCSLSESKIINVTFQDAGDGSVLIRIVFFIPEHTIISFNKRTIPLTHLGSAWEVKRIVDFLGGSGIAHSVEILHFQHCPVLPPERFISESLLKLGRLKTLVIWQSNPKFFLELPPPPAVWCPNVEELVICPLPYGDPREPGDTLEQVLDISMSRLECPNPLKAFTLYHRDIEGLLQICGRQIVKLMDCVQYVEVL